jgi:hypothetical protein
MAGQWASPTGQAWYQGREKREENLREKKKQRMGSHSRREVRSERNS